MTFIPELFCKNRVKINGQNNFKNTQNKQQNQFLKNNVELLLPAENTSKL